MATNPKTSLFDGTFCRKPIQNFGGRRNNDSRETLLKKAKLDREKREKERQVAQSIVVVQASVRSFLARRAFKKSCREEYDKNKKPTYSEGEFANQIKLLTQFYDPAKDSNRLQEMAWWVLKEQTYVVEKCNNRDFVWIHRIRLFARYCVAALRNALIVPASTRYLRLVEIFTEERKSVETAGPSYFTVIIWLDLILRGDFFKLWREILESRQSGTYSAAATAYLDILDRPINLISRLKNFPDLIAFSAEQLTGSQACELIFTRFVEAFGKQVIPCGSEGSSQVVAQEIIPRISHGFPFTEFLNFLVSYDSQRNGDNDRSMLYMVLVLSKTNSAVDPLLLTKVVMKYLSSIEKPCAPFDPYRTDYLYELHLSGVTLQDLDDLQDYMADISSNVQYLKEVHAIYHMLADTLENHIQLISLINPSTMEYWDWFCRILSCMVCIDERTSEKIPNLATIAFRKDILRPAYLKAMANSGDMVAALAQKHNQEAIIGFCWGFNHLLGALHDDEFLTAVPMSLEELENLIRNLILMYEDIALKEYVPYDALVNTVKYNILWTLRSLYDRNTRLQYVPDMSFKSQYAHIYLPLESHDLDFDSFADYRATPFRRSAFFLTDPTYFVNNNQCKLLQVLNEAPFVLTFDNRINVWHRLLDNDRLNRDLPINPRDHIQIRRSLLYEDAYEKLSVENVPDVRANVRISLVNVVGAPEAGVDGGGLLREFLIEATKAGVDPNRGFFRLDSQNRIYPNPVARVMDPNFRKHFYLMGRLVGKALYEQILLELPFAAFFIQACISGHVPSAVDYLATLDPALHKNLLNLRNYQGDWNAIGLDFTVTNDEFGKVRSIELKKNGADIYVNKSNVIEYIHLVAEYKINKEMEDECRAFRSGLMDVVPILRMFSWREMKILISGSDKPINVQDWKANINYSGGYTEDHPTIVLFWQVVENFQEEYLRKLLKFVTSCSRPPLLGFKYLIPNFGIQNTGFETDRLPTAATCMNLLKLPQYTEASVIRQKLMYVVDAQAGFELS